MEGDKRAVEALITRHQRWICDMAFRMVMAPEDTEEVAQEVLVKILTGLGSYDPEKGAFRTWRYRVVTNHVLSMKARGREKALTGFDTYAPLWARSRIRTPQYAPATALITEDLKIGCVTTTPLSLDRTQRLVLILAVVFGPDRSTLEEVVGRFDERFTLN